MSLSACSRPAAPERTAPAPSAAPAPAEPPVHYGEVMAEVGRRFEMAGRAAQVGRYALAKFEIGEMDEAIDDDLPHAEPPRAGDPKKLAALLDGLRHKQLPAMAKATDDSDGAAFARAFAAASETCNACHQATQHAFIEIPSVPGKSVPLLDPVSQPAASGSAAAAASAPAPQTSGSSHIPQPIIEHPPKKPVPVPIRKPLAR